MIGRTEKLNQMCCGFDVAGQGIAEVRIEVRQTRTIHNQIDHACQALPGFSIQAESRQSHIAFHYLDFFREKRAQGFPIALFQPVENWRGFYDLLKSAPGRAVTLPPDQQIDLPNLRNFGKEVLEPNFADEACDTQQQNLFPPYRLAHRKTPPRLP